MSAPAARPPESSGDAEQEPSEWIVRWSHLVRPGSSVLDVACGRGRHLRWFAGRGCHPTGVDRSAPALAVSAGLAAEGRATLVEADIEGQPWPLAGADGPRQFDVVVVTHYLWRPLLPILLDSVAPGGLLLYETFSVDQAAIGRPSRADFLLQHGELFRLCADWRIVAYEDGYRDAPPGCVQRIAAVRPGAPASIAGGGPGQGPGDAAPRFPLRNQR